MIFKAKPIENKLIEEAYQEALKVFGDFWVINWVYNTPNIIVLDNREDMDKAKGRKTQEWVRGIAWGNTVYILDYDKQVSESSHKDSTKEEYQAMIRHEIGHLFTQKIINSSEFPLWLNEGISIFLANQLTYNKKPEFLKGFLDSSQTDHKAAYVEGGHIVALLINLFGKAKFINFVKEKGDSQKFKEIYGFDLTYENINVLYHSHEVSKNEAIDKLKEIIDKHFQFQVKHDGALEIKSQSYLLSIERKWDIWGTGGEFHSFDFVSLKDEEKIEKFIGKSKITGIDIAKDSIFSFLFESGIQLAITASSYDSGFYFKLFSFKANEPTLALTSSFKFILLSNNLI